MYVSSGPPAEVPASDDPTSMRVGGVDITDLRHALADTNGTHESVAARLVARGLVEDCAIGSVEYQPKWAVTEFGLEVLVFLQSCEDEPLQRESSKAVPLGPRISGARLGTGARRERRSDQARPSSARFRAPCCAPRSSPQCLPRPSLSQAGRGSGGESALRPRWLPASRIRCGQPARRSAR